MNETIVPYGKEGGSKRQQVEMMFDNISGKYDFLNHFLSLGIDRVWRRKSLGMVAQAQPGQILDVATGTGDFAIAAKRKYPSAEVVGIDISKGMLEIGIKKLETNKLKGIRLVHADSAKIPFANGHFDLALVAFGVRNFEHLEQGLGEMYRVLKPNGELVVLEFSKPKPFPFKQLYNFYFNYILPFFGKTISKDPAAYTYLPESVKHFPEGADFVEKLKQVGFERIHFRPLTFGVSTIYHAYKAN
ncbi:MAG: bifunctional demethylmenaquinone methyltransferase/2-methoxy-6-polyprenyl-1,4-benzoquinol methylase UbiE [Bacteroidetes bacterium]|nr:bifunctional demethylmenaquinone methyltransferase/2-methoxy-6-polyprenyl-1,4-benzoquinol methylase UbiE [Bacteroidota bacterium]